jgi:hypothetical protein
MGGNEAGARFFRNTTEPGLIRASPGRLFPDRPVCLFPGIDKENTRFIRSEVCSPAPWGGYNWQRLQKTVVDPTDNKFPHSIEPPLQPIQHLRYCTACRTEAYSQKIFFLTNARRWDYDHFYIKCSNIDHLI